MDDVQDDAFGEASDAADAGRRVVQLFRGYGHLPAVVGFNPGGRDGADVQAVPGGLSRRQAAAGRRGAVFQGAAQSDGRKGGRAGGNDVVVVGYDLSPRCGVNWRGAGWCSLKRRRRP